MINYLNNLRGFAILMVVLQHSIYSISDEAREEFPMVFLLSNSTFLFVVIAGYFFSLLSHKYTYSGYIKSKFKNVIVPYLVVSVPAILIYILGFKTNHSWMHIDEMLSGSYLKAVLVFYLTGGHLGPLWFVPMISLFYIAYPVFIWILKSRCFLFSFILISFCSGFYFGRPALNDNTFLSFNYFLFAYLLGFVLERSRLHERISPLTSVLLIPFLLILNSALFESGYSYSVDLVCKALYSLLIYSLFLNWLDFKSSVLGFLGDKSFFIFFIHGYFIGLSRYVDFGLSDFFQSVAIFLITLSGTVVCYFGLKRLFKSRMRILFGSN
jgi:peptidoglycan/LPS O-acetylase OafA/YrhL